MRRSPRLVDSRPPAARIKTPTAASPVAHDGEVLEQLFHLALGVLEQADQDHPLDQQPQSERHHAGDGRRHDDHREKLRGDCGRAVLPLLGLPQPPPAGPEINQHGEHRSRVQHHEQKDLLGPRRVHPHQPLRENDVRRTGDGQQFGRPLDQCQQGDLQIVKEGHQRQIWVGGLVADCPANAARPNDVVGSRTAPSAGRRDGRIVTSVSLETAARFSDAVERIDPASQLADFVDVEIVVLVVRTTSGR